jgi:hypothetical protein
MDFLKDLLKDLPREIVIVIVTSPVVFLLGYGFNRLKKIILSIRAGRFWNRFVKDGLLVLGSGKVPEPTRCVPVGDAMAFVKLQTYFKSEILSDIDFKIADSLQLQGDDLKSNLILIGGPGINNITKRVLNMIKSQLSLSFSSLTGRTVVRDSRTGKEYELSRNRDTGEVTEDYAMIIKTQNPLNPCKLVLIIAGISGYGTWAGAEHTISEEFQKTSLVSDRKSFECLLQTDVALKRPHNVREVIPPRKTGQNLEDS